MRNSCGIVSTTSADSGTLAYILFGAYIAALGEIAYVAADPMFARFPSLVVVVLTLQFVTFAILSIQARNSRIPEIRSIGTVDAPTAFQGTKQEEIAIMSLIYCPECRHEISTAAVACPSCGRPLTSATNQVPSVIIERQPKTDSVPPWVIAPVVLLGVIVLFSLIYLFTSGNDSNSNLALNVNAHRAETARANTTSADVSSIPPSATDTTGAGYSVQPQNVPGTSGSIPQSGIVLIDAKVATSNGSTQGARNARFYLLDKDIETILSDADIEPIEGQSPANSLAIATADQARYRDFYRDAMEALKEHIKYTGSTDGAGKAQLGSVKPDQYYLFGVARTGEGFAMWNSSVSVIAGENAVNLTPQQLTQMPAAMRGE